ncbi:MAG TPA: cation diffusion facilitator family transporter [Kofleriaceae bacterium]|nr:cation diffusion facilitator family transporter [Kofleriaceae bacterium]
MASSRVTFYAAMAANVAIALTKVGAAAWSHSSAMLAEAIHSIVDTGDGALMLVGTALARRPPDQAHPFGHGKELYFWTLIVGMLVFSVGGGVSTYEGIARIQHPREAIGWQLNLVVIGAAAAFESGSFAIAWRHYRDYRREHGGEGGLFEAFHRTKDPAAFVVVLEDGAALIGLAFAAAGVTLGHLLGSAVYDGAASVAIGLVLATVATLLAYETRGLLIGESAMRGVVRSIRNRAEQTPGLARLNRVLTMHLGPHELLVALDVAFEPSLSAPELNRAAGCLERTIRDVDAAIKHVYLDLHALAPAEARAAAAAGDEDPASTELPAPAPV